MERRAGKLYVRIVVDALMAVVFVFVMSTALVQEAPHEFLGIALFALAIVHVVLNRRWFTVLARGRWTALRALQVVAVVGLLLCLIGQVASSVVLSKHAFSFLPAIPGAAWARRVHMLCSYWGFVFAFAHAGLQFKSVLSWVCSGPRGTRNSSAVWIARAVFAIAACCGVYSFIRLDLLAYLTGQVQFAYADFSVPLALTFAQYAAVAALIAGAFHYLRKLIIGKRKDENG